MVSLAQVLQFMFAGSQPGADFVVQDDGAGPYIVAWRRPEPQPTPAEIAAAVLPATKAARIEADRQECTRRILEVWPAEKQLSLALGGIYSEADRADCAAWVAANVDASNAARDAILAAQTVAAVDAVSVAWPTYTGG